MKRFDEAAVFRYLRVDKEIYHHISGDLEAAMDDYIEQKYPQTQYHDSSYFKKIIQKHTYPCTMEFITEHVSDAVINSVFAGIDSHQTSSELTTLLLIYLESYILGKNSRAVVNLLHRLPRVSARLMCASYTLELFSNSQIMTAKQAAVRYDISVQSVSHACRNKLLPTGSFIQTSNGWLLEQHHADTFWKKHIRESVSSISEQKTEAS